MSFFEQDGGCCGEFGCLAGSNLVLQIFARLDFRDLFRVRCVCKSWCDAILSLEFLKLWRGEENLDGVWAVLDVRTNHVSSLSTSHGELWYPFSCMSKRSPCMSSMPDIPKGAEFLGLFSSHGLVCGQLWDPDDDTKRGIRLVVGNPMTNTWKQLPLPPTPYVCMQKVNHNSCTMERDPVSGCYTIIIMLVHRFNHCVCQYESKLGAWFIPLWDPIKIPTGSLVLVDPLWSSRFIVYDYDPSAMSWSHLKIDFPSNFRENEVDTQWKGIGIRPLAGFKYKGSFISTTTFVNRSGVVGAGVWELDEENSAWKLVSRTMLKDLYGDGGYNGEQWKCQLVDDIIIISACYNLHYSGFSVPIAYSLLNLTWTTALRDAIFVQRVECSYAFIPSLTAEV